MRLQVRTRPHRQVSIPPLRRASRLALSDAPQTWGGVETRRADYSLLCEQSGLGTPPPQLRTDPVFTRTLVRLAEAEVLVLAYACRTTHSRVKIQHPLAVLLTASMH